MKYTPFGIILPVLSLPFQRTLICSFNVVPDRLKFLIIRPEISKILSSALIFAGRTKLISTDCLKGFGWTLKLVVFTINSDISSTPVDVIPKKVIIESRRRDVFKSYRTREDRYREVLVRARTPVERLVFDQIVHLDLIGPHDPELFIFGEFTGYDWSKPAEFRNPNSSLPMSVSIHKLGMGIKATYTPYIQWYTDMIEDVFSKLQWDPSKFRTYRVVIDYPVIPSTVNMRSLLPEKQ